MKKMLANLVVALCAGAIASAVIRTLLRESLNVVERMDRLAREQAARHAYGPNVRTETTPQPIVQPDVSSAPPEIANHRFAPGTRMWDDDQLGKLIDPLDTVIDNPFAADGQMMMSRFVDRGGAVESDL